VEDAEPVRSLAGAVERASQRWGTLLALIEPLPADEFVRSRPDGWSVRDHVVHVTAWERSLLALLLGQSRPQAIGLTDEEEAALELDDINARILARAAHLSPAEVRQQSAETHAELMQMLRSLTDADVNLPYSHYQPGPGENAERPVFGWIAGNTFEHYEEHIGWLRQAGVGG
jgi:uncharacterized damage-inducible protein DinB